MVLVRKAERETMRQSVGFFKGFLTTDVSLNSVPVDFFHSLEELHTKAQCCVHSGLYHFIVTSVSS